METRNIFTIHLTKSWFWKYVFEVVGADLAQNRTCPKNDYKKGTVRLNSNPKNEHLFWISIITATKSDGIGSDVDRDNAIIHIRILWALSASLDWLLILSNVLVYPAFPEVSDHLIEGEIILVMINKYSQNVNYQTRIILQNHRKTFVQQK